MSKVKASQSSGEICSMNDYDIRHFEAPSDDWVHLRKPSIWPEGPSVAALAEGLAAGGRNRRKQ